jgi:hypothetical protein
MMTRMFGFFPGEAPGDCALAMIAIEKTARRRVGTGISLSFIGVSLLMA